MLATCCKHVSAVQLMCKMHFPTLFLIPKAHRVDLWTTNTIEKRNKCKRTVQFSSVYSLNAELTKRNHTWNRPRIKYVKIIDSGNNQWLNCKIRSGGAPVPASPHPFPSPFPLPLPFLFPSSLHPFPSIPFPLPSPPFSLSPLLPSPPFPLPLPLEVGPINAARGSGERCKLPQRSLGLESGAEPQPKSNLVHSSREIWHLVATISLIFLRISWSIFLHFN